MNAERIPFIILHSSFILLLVACTALPIGDGQPENSSLPTPAAVLPQPTSALGTQNAELGIQDPAFSIQHSAFSIQTVDVRITHVRDLSEILVQPSDRIEAGQALAQLDGYAEELNRDAQLIELELAQARAKLEDARRRATSDHEQQINRTETRIAELDRRLAELTRQKQIADAGLAEAQTTTAYRQRWLEILQPLDEFDPWGDLPYLVGSQNGPQGRRSDLAYREAVAKAEYDLQQARLAQQIAEQETADVAAQLQQTQANLEAAQTALEHLRATPPAINDLPTVSVYADSVRINELRLAQAQADLDQTVVKSLMAGQVLEVRVDRIDGNEATVVIRITSMQN